MQSKNAFQCCLNFTVAEPQRVTSLIHITPNFEAETEILRPRPECLKTEAKNHEAEAEVEAKILASSPAWQLILVTIFVLSQFRLRRIAQNTVRSRPSCYN